MVFAVCIRLFFLKKKATAASYLRNRIDLTSIVDFTRLETLFNPIRSATKDWKERMPSRPFPMGNELIDASRLESAHSMAVSSHCILVATNLINEPLLTDDWWFHTRIETGGQQQKKKKRRQHLERRPWRRRQNPMMAWSVRDCHNIAGIYCPKMKTSCKRTDVDVTPPSKKDCTKHHQQIGSREPISQTQTQRGGKAPEPKFRDAKEGSESVGRVWIWFEWNLEW